MMKIFIDPANTFGERSKCSYNKAGQQPTTTDRHSES